MFIRVCGDGRGKWGNIWLFNCDIATRVIIAIVVADVAIAGTGKGGEVTNALGLFFWDVADAVAIIGEYLDGVWVVWVGWVGYERANELTKVVVYVVDMIDAGNDKLQTFADALFSWPNGDVIAFVFDTKILQPFHLWLFDGIAIPVEQFKVLRLVCFPWIANRVAVLIEHGKMLRGRCLFGLRI